MSDVRLRNEDINSDVEVNLNGVSVTYRWNNFTKTPDIPSKFLDTEDPQVVTDFIGWTNPRIVIRGIIDTNNYGTNGLTIGILKQFAKAKVKPTYIFESALYPNSVTYKVQIESFTLTRRKADDDNEGRIDYTITLVETL